MSEEILEEEIKEVTIVDKDGNSRTVYYIWHTVITYATLIFYEVHLRDFHR